jgi:hypothetical protein
MTHGLNPVQTNENNYRALSQSTHIWIKMIHVEYINLTGILSSHACGRGGQRQKNEGRVYMYMHVHVYKKT